VFTLLFSVVHATGAFDITPEQGVQIDDTESALGDTTSLETPNMNYLITLVLAGAGVGLVIGWITHSIVPVGISIFSTVFWAAYINAHGILSIGNFIPSELLLIFTVCTVFIFIAAIVGMITGSG